MDAAISPNGTLLAFADASGLNLKVIASGEVHSLFAPSGAANRSNVGAEHAPERVLNLVLPDGI